MPTNPMYEAVLELSDEKLSDPEFGAVLTHSWALICEAAGKIRDAWHKVQA